jgi:hypothetical protein
MSDGHARVALEAKEGAEKAITDFREGLNSNPFTRFSGQWNAYRRQMDYSLNRRACREAGHDQADCCWEHDRHIRMWNKSQWGIKSCPVCEERAEIERAKVAS